MTNTGNNLITYDEQSRSSVFKSYSRSVDLNMFETDSKAMIHDVGNYSISVVRSTDELINRIDWDKFNKPADLNSRIATINNTKLFPFDNKAIIVAVANTSIEDDGFGVIYSAPHIRTYFPTCHEQTNKSCSYDVQLYELNNDISNVLNKKMFKCQTQRQYGKSGNYVHCKPNNMSKSFLGECNKAYKNMLYALLFQTNLTWASNGKSDICNIRDISYIEYTPIKTTSHNQNIIDFV